MTQPPDGSSAPAHSESGPTGPEPALSEPALSEPALHPPARDLVRKRRRSYAAPDTGRRHHIGSAPEAVPLHTAAGVDVTRVTAWQLADRTPAQLTAQQGSTASAMRAAAEALDFEAAARLRDELTAVEEEINRRAARPADPHDLESDQDDDQPTSSGAAE